MRIRVEPPGGRGFVHSLITAPSNRNTDKQKAPLWDLQDGIYSRSVGNDALKFDAGRLFDLLG